MKVQAFSLIQDFVNSPNLIHGERERLLQEKCARKWDIPHSDRTSIGRSTIQRGIQLYEDSGCRLESLYPKERSDKGSFRVLDGDSSQILKQLRKEMPDRTVPFILKTLEEDEKRPASVSSATVYRFFNQHNLMRPGKAQEDHRKFEADHPNEMWQSDVMHGPHVEMGGKQRKSYLIAVIDDHSRLIVHGGFYKSETTLSFMDAFEQALCHARPYQPQGKGKIERFFKTVRSQFLPGFTGTRLDELNDAFEAWLYKEYNDHIHSATGQTPLNRFVAGIECLRPSPEDLKDHFRKKVRRRVNKDRTIILDKHLFEGPVALIGKQVDLLYHDNEYERVELHHQKRSYGFLKEVDPHVNYRVRRDKNNDPVIISDDSTPLSGQMWGSDS